MDKIILPKYIIYGLLGLCLEVFWTGLESLSNSNYILEGKTSIWMFFIYGLAVFLEPIHNKIRDKNVLVRGLIYMILIFTIEYLTGYLFRLLLGFCPWNYTDIGSIHGLITLTFIPVWFFAGLLFEKVHDTLEAVSYNEGS